MSTLTENLKKDLEKGFGKALEVTALRDVGTQSELTIVVKPGDLLQVLTFLKGHKETPMHYLRCLTAIDYPKQFLPPPSDVDPFMSISTLEMKGRAQEHTGTSLTGKSAPLDPPRLDPQEMPFALNTLEAIQSTWKDMRIMWGSPPLKPKAEPADVKVNNEAKAKMVIDIKKIVASEAKKALPAPKIQKRIDQKPSVQAVPVSAPKPLAQATPESKPLAPQTQVVPAIFAPAKFDMDKITMVYTLVHMDSNTQVHVRVDLDRATPQVDSITPLWPAANWYEREVFDLYGVIFKNHPDPRRIFMDYPQFSGGYPLRKDYQRPGFMVRLPKV